jgi:HK97 family phage major capsid protein
MKPYAEQIAAFEARRTTAHARMAEIMTAAGEAGATLDAAQQEEFDGLEQDITAIDGHIHRLKLLEAQAVHSGTPIIVTDPSSGAAVRAAGLAGGGADVGEARVITVQRNVRKGLAFTRYAIALMRSKGNLMQAVECARAWRDTPDVELVLRAAVAAGTTTDPAWAEPLVQYQNMIGEFIELLRPATIIGNIQGFRRVPFNIKMPSQTSGSSANWVGEGKPKPVSALGFGTVMLGFTKAAGIVVMTDELVRFSNPSAEGIVQQDLIETIAQFLDVQFIDPTVVAVAGVNPASITNGAPNFPATGESADALRSDITTVFAMFSQANMSVAGAYWIMHPVMALSISMMMNSLGQPEFPGINMNGGTLWGLPVVCSNSVPNQPGDIATATPATSMITIMKPSEILMADDGGVALDASREASLQLDSAPTPGAAQLVSLWQNNMIALRAERFINWQPRRASAVAYITDARYGGPFILPPAGDSGSGMQASRGVVTGTRGKQQV